VPEPRCVRGVIFDLGGTLVCNHPQPEDNRERRQCEAIGALVAAEVGYASPKALADRLVALRIEGGQLAGRDLIERRARDTIARAFREQGIAASDELIDRAERVLFEPDRHSRELYPGARELLEMLRTRGLRIGLISNWSSHYIVTHIATSLGIHEYFAPLVSSAAFGRIKPHPAIFQHVLDAWHRGPQDVAMVGDTLSTDIAGAAAVGMRSILVEIEPNPPNDRFVTNVRPAYRVGHLLEIPPLLGSAR